MNLPKKPSNLRLLALLTALAMLPACARAVGDAATDLSTSRAPVRTTTAASTDDGTPERPVEGGYEWDPHVFDLLSGGYQSSAEKLADAILAYEDSVTLESGQAQTVVDNFAFEFPPAALVELSVDDDRVTIDYLSDKAAHEDKLAAFESAVEGALNGTVTPADSETVRALLLYRYVVENVRYFTVDYTEKEITAFSALTEGVTICYGFADAFGYLLRQTGMEAHLYRGNSTSGGEHGWCYAKVDGRFYHFDPTWETSNQKTTGTRSLTYFGMDDTRRFRTLKKACVYGFGALEKEGVNGGADEWLLPTDLYPYNDWSFDRETGMLSADKGSVKLGKN